MALTVSYNEGDGVNDDLYRLNIQLPDADGGSLVIVGQVQNKGGAIQSVTGSPLTIPAHPGSGSIYYNVQVDYTSGAATLQQSTVSAPAALANNKIVFSQTLTSATTDDALAAEVTPVVPVGAP